MVRVGVLGDVAGHLEQLHLDLEGGVGQLAQQLGLGDNFGGHQVEYEQVQGAGCPGEGHGAPSSQRCFQTPVCHEPAWTPEYVSA